MDSIASNRKIFTLHEYSEEREFEVQIIKNAGDIFGLSSATIFPQECQKYSTTWCSVER